MTYYTDYPITQFGDEAGEEAPIREVEIIFWDMDKYVHVYVQGPMYKFRTSIKYGYIYKKSGRSGSVPCISFNELNEIQAQKYLELRHAALKVQAAVASEAMEGRIAVPLWDAHRHLAGKTQGSHQEFVDMESKNGQ